MLHYKTDWKSLKTQKRIEKVDVWLGQERKILSTDISIVYSQIDYI